MDIVSSYDQPLQKGLWADPDWKLLMDSIDWADEACEEMGHLEPIAEVVQRMVKGSVLNVCGVGRGLSIGLVRARKFGLTDGAYADFIYIKTGLSARTSRSYIKMWSLMEKGSPVPTKHRRRLLERPMRSLRAIQKTTEAMEIPEADWKRIIDAEDHKTLVDVLREVEGKDPPAVRMNIQLGREGDLTAWEGDAKPAVLGFLRVGEDDLENKLRKKAISLILRAAGIQHDFMEV